MILLLDNYDSFVYNLDRYLQRLGQRTLVVRSDAVTVDAISRLDISAIVISPGPKAPDTAGCSMEVVRRFYRTIPILGVCLGHQAIGAAFGARIARAGNPMHGKSSTIRHKGSRLLQSLPLQFNVGRYHSLVIEPNTLPIELEVTAWSDDGAIMAIEHRDWPLFGVQFHPESILTEYGYEILGSFLSHAQLQPEAIPNPDWVGCD
jgi:anthranilate synthase component II